MISILNVSRSKRLDLDGIQQLARDGWTPKPGSRLIYVAGMSGAGTTLLNRMMLTFNDFLVKPNEIPFWRFPALVLDEGPLIAAKGAPLSWLRGVSEIDVDWETKRKIILSAAERVDVIVASRDARSWARTKRSRRFGLDNYCAVAEQVAACRDDITAIVPTERLIAEPDQVQAELGKKLDLPWRAAFSDYPSFVDDDWLKRDVPGDNHRPRPLESGVVEKVYDLEYLADWCQVDASRLESALSVYGYEV